MMKKIMLWCLVYFISGNLHSQTLYLKNQEGEPIIFATISGINPSQIAITDVNGKADISTFIHSEEIRVSYVGFKTYVGNYESLKRLDFHLRLKEAQVKINEVVISAYKEGIRKESSLNIQTLQLTEIERGGAYNLSGALAEVPGVSQLSSGTGISKPVIRGLYGNRVLVLFSGLRFDNQQWQDEHGLGLSDIGIEKVEIIKGPLSLLYGTEAIGGVLNIIEEKPPAAGMQETDFKTVFHSNTRGGTVQAGVKANYGKKWYRIRVGADSYADYHNGNSAQVINSRFNGYYLKSTYGFQNKNWKSDNHYALSYNKFGFIFNGNSEKYVPSTSGWDRRMIGPHHIVVLNTISSVNRFKLSESVLSLNAGIQSNRRAEDEGGDELSLDMHLFTAQYSLKWNKPLNEHTNLIISHNFSWENNLNLGRRKLVPDANMLESTFSLYLRHEWSKVIIEGGVGGGERYIESRFTPTVNSAEKEIDPFEQSRSFFNAMAGLSLILNPKWNVKVNVSSGVRAPNLSELSSNGLHEGIYTYEVGNPDLKNERNINGEIQLNYSGNKWEWTTAAFYNHFNNYIYLKASGGEWFGFPIYHFRQQNAHLYGTESTVKYHSAETMEYSLTYEGLVGQQNDGNYLPYMPANKIRPAVQYEKNKWLVSSSLDYVLQQNLVSNEEKITASYHLWNIGACYYFNRKNAQYNLGIRLNNLLNEAYYSHLSRLKNFGLLNPGRDLSLTLQIKFNNNLKIKNYENNQ